jgi:hypothetical protein
MLITSLSVPGKHLDCAPRPYGDIYNKLYNAYVIWTGAGMTLQVSNLVNGFHNFFASLDVERGAVRKSSRWYDGIYD